MRNDPGKPKVVLITGGATRIGASIAQHLHKLGSNVIIHYRQSKAAAESLCTELNTLRNNSACCIKADLLDNSDLEILVKKALSQWEKLDVLINNASSFYPTPLSEINKEQWQDLIGTNANAPAFLCKACAPALHDTKGCIINISDIAASTGRKNFLIYSMAKAALNILTRSLARELAPDIRVNAIAPGVILAPNFSSGRQVNNNAPDTMSDNTTEEAEADPLSLSCLNYSGKAEDIAFAAAFLTNNTYTTGQILNVDGGRRLKF